jgi:hypothetical protein
MVFIIALVHLFVQSPGKTLVPTLLARVTKSLNVGAFWEKLRVRQLTGGSETEQTPLVLRTGSRFRQNSLFSMMLSTNV